MNSYVAQDLADAGCTCCADEIYPAPICSCCNTPMFWDSGMGTCSGYGWFCTTCGFNMCLNCGTGDGVTFFDVDGNTWHSGTA